MYYLYSSASSCVHVFAWLVGTERSISLLTIELETFNQYLSGLQIEYQQWAQNQNRIHENTHVIPKKTNYM